MGSARSRRYLFQSQPDLEERIATCSSHYPHRHRHSTGETGGIWGHGLGLRPGLGERSDIHSGYLVRARATTDQSGQACQGSQCPSIAYLRVYCWTEAREHGGSSTWRASIETTLTL